MSDQGATGGASALVALQVLTPLITGWIGWSVRTLKTCWSKDITAMKQRMEALEQDHRQTEERIDQMHEVNREELMEIKERTLPREDFIRETARSRQSIERLTEGVARLEGKLDVGTRIAASVETIAATIAMGANGKD